MSISGNILKIDALLDQLDAFAATKPQQTIFWNRWLEELRQIYQAVGVSMILSVDVAAEPDFDADQKSEENNPQQNELFRVGEWSENSLELSCIHEGTRSRWQTEIHFQDEDAHFGPCVKKVPAPLCAEHPEGQSPAEGAEHSFSAQPLTARSLHQIAGGFLETAQRYMQMSATDRNAASRAVSDFRLRLSDINQVAAFDHLISEDFCRVLMASQVSVVRHKAGESCCVATTGLPKIATKNTALETIESEAERYQRSQQQLSISPISTAQYSVMFSLEIVEPKPSGAPRSVRTVRVEWTDADTMLNTIDALTEIIPALRQVQRRIQDQESHSQNGSLLGQAAMPGGRFLSRKKIVALGSIAALSLIVLLTKDIRTPHVVDATGLLHPLNQKVIYSNCIGYVDEVYTDHEQTVEKSQMLLQLRSPDADLKLQEIEGELAGATQQREGLRLTLNQAKSGSSETQIVAFQLSSEIAALDAKLAGLLKQKDILLQQIASHQLTAPIDGTVITRDLQRKLLSKPVVLGEPLLRVCDTAGPWILRLEIDQRDIAAVRSEFQGPTDSTETMEDRNLSVAFRLASEPEKIYSGRVTHIDVVVTQSSQEQSSLGRAANVSRQVVRVEVDFDMRQIMSPQIDASVIAKIDCGQDFWWRNWTRQLVDALRRRFWINV